MLRVPDGRVGVCNRAGWVWGTSKQRRKQLGLGFPWKKLCIIVDTVYLQLF